MVLIHQSFSALAQNTTERIASEQLNEVGEIVLSGVYRAHSSYKEDVDYERIETRIPKEISGEMYKISVEGDKIRVTSEIGEEITKDMGFPGDQTNYNIEMQRDFMNGVSSRKGTITIELDGDQIKIGR